MIVPEHEQSWPSKLLRTRLQEYVLPDGPPTTDRRRAVYVKGQQVYDAVIKAQHAHEMREIDPRYFVGTCFHEAGCTNEWDTEIATKSCPEGFVSVGAFQIGHEEAKAYGFELADMLDLEKASSCMVQMAQHNLSQIIAAAAMAAGRGKSNAFDCEEGGELWTNGGLRAYLAIAHNHGVGYVRATIANYGLDWGRYKQRNPTDHIVDHGYGTDCVTGGTWFKKVRI